MERNIDELGREYDERPWGCYVVLDDQPSHKVKKLTVNVGSRLSYQRHAKREEHWFILRGSGVVTIDGVDTPINKGEAVDIGIGQAHRIANSGDQPLVIIEVQRGSYFGEDDLVRMEDDYGRGNKSR